MSSSAIHHATQPPREKTPRNPLQLGLWSFITNSRLLRDRCSDLSLQHLPKRFTIYPPLLLLPVNFAAHDPLWQEFYSHLDADQKSELFGFVAHAFIKAGQAVTHVAINAHISALEFPGEALSKRENVMRSPSKLIPVYGNFGPSSLLEPAANIPSQQDFDAAFWVSTSQSRNVSQTWAPRWTMFSRGNVTEKTRILDGRDDESLFPGLTESQLAQQLRDVEVVDLYVGIGYFAFSYLANGVRRVYGWDLNPWSIEGLRRGCEANGWRCVIVQVNDDGRLDGISVDQLAKLLCDDNVIRCVAFRGDNRWAASILGSLDKAIAVGYDSRSRLRVRHVNLGLLPSSRVSWDTALTIIVKWVGGWLHVHENVDIHEIAAKSKQVVHEMMALLRAQECGSWQVECQHIQEVKTYAPGVMHCVFDIYVRPVA